MQEKLEPRDEDLEYFHWPVDEPTPKFKRRISVGLVEMVNQMLMGEIIKIVVKINKYGIILT